MNRIRLLPEQVANQIAAGEVVERPASVVKELVENALDAQATRITVEIQAGGRGLIRVADDGVGMSRDDALLCLERHATSKISRAEELNAIDSFGFRGEAIPSIASVCRFTLTTRERDGAAPDATQIIIQGGKIAEVRSAAGPPGTSVEVRQLFYNLPARRKFLKSDETERAHIQHYLLFAALAYAETGFTFIQDGRVIWQLTPLDAGPDPEARLAALESRLKAVQNRPDPMLRVDQSGTIRLSRATQRIRGEPEDVSGEEAEGDAATEGVRLWGLIGAPGVSRSTREDQHLFVNRRPVDNRGLNFALMEGYHTALMKGRYPVCTLFLEIDPALVDVNIHPSKREVKFREDFQVRRFVTQAVRRTLLKFHSGIAPADKPAAPTRAPELRPSGSPPPAPRGSPAEGLASQLAARAQPVQKPETPEQRTADLPGFAPASQHVEIAPPSDAPADRAQLTGVGHAPPPSDARTPEPPHPPGGAGRSGLPAQAAAHSAPVPAAAAAPGTVGPTAVPLLDVPLRVLGVIGKLYVVCESDRGMVLMDQHAAHERVLFEQMLGRLEQGPAPSQRLLLPETVELAPKDAQFLRENLDGFARLGVGLSEFGDRTFLLDAMPPFVKAPDARRFVVELIDELKACGSGVNPLRLGEEMIAKTVCRHAVKANDPLSPEEIENLIRDLRGCAMPYTCPHGRPTLIELSLKELEKKFGRIQG